MGFPRFQSAHRWSLVSMFPTAGMMPPNSVQDTCLLLTSFFVCMICVGFLDNDPKLTTRCRFSFFCGGEGLFFLNKGIFQRFQRSVALIRFVCFVLSVVYDEVQRQGDKTCQMHPGQQVRASHPSIWDPHPGWLFFFRNEKSLQIHKEWSNLDFLGCKSRNFGSEAQAPPCQRSRAWLKANL